MYEVEVKVRADHDAVRERLADAGAERVAGVVQTDTYYDAPHRDFAETEEALRLRREREAAADDESRPEAATRVTYKGPLVEAESKTREEFETGVGDGETAHELLSRLGFEPAATVEKERERYALDGYTVTLDAVDGLGEFVEVEREVPASEVESAREGAFEVLRSLGLDPDDGITASYLGMLLSDEE